MNNKTERVEWLDVAKGYTIILMVLGHTSIPTFFSNFIWAFHMPLFFLASGWCTNWAKDYYEAFVLKKLRTLGIPFMVYSIVVIFIAWLAGYQEIGWKGVLVKGWEGYALWFIPVLFFSFVIAKFIMSFIRQTWLRYAICVLLILGGVFLHYRHVYLPWALATVPYATCLIMMGSSLKKCQQYIDKPRWWIFVIGILLTIVISQNWRMDLAWNNITPVIPLTIGAISGTCMMFVFSSFVRKKSPALGKIFAAIGRETYMILALSQIIIIVMNQHTNWNAPIRYSILIAVLFAFYYLKNLINQLMDFKLLA